MQFKKMSGDEVRLAKMWYEDDDMSPREIADLLRRDKSTITRHVVKGVIPKPQGRPRALSEAERQRLPTDVETGLQTGLQTVVNYVQTIQTIK